MERNNISAFSNESFPKNSASPPESDPGPTFLAWWYSHFAPAKPSANASLSQREEARHGRLASITIPLFMLFLLVLLSMFAFTDKNAEQIIGAFVGEGICVVILFLNRKGFVKIAGVVILTLIYAGGTFSILNLPVGLTIVDFPRLDLTILPDILALAFFSSDSLFLIVGINIVQTLGMVLLGPHDAAVTRLLQTDPLRVFFSVFLLQITTAVILYLWARSSENAIARADRAEEIAAVERYQKELKEQELEQKRQLDAGIQEILRTHVAVANGDLTARAPLHQTHVLWQVANALNTLIARIQRLSQTEQELRQRIRKANEQAAEHATAQEQSRITNPRIKATNPQVPM